MNFINRLILNKGEKFLAPFRLNENILNTSEFSNYSSYLPIIKKCYENTKYWHGTGRYQYMHTNDSRYQNIDFTKHIDVLESILKENGLRPHDEPWLKNIQKIYKATVSMTKFRMYARLYAGLYLYEKDSLLYQFGTTKFWFKLLFRIQILDRKFLYFIFTKGLFRLARISSYKNAQIWIRSIRNDTNKKSMSPFRGHLIQTDIVENYPILIGIKNIEIIHFNSGMERFEARTTKQVFLNDITHIEVPLKKVKETEEFLKEKNITLQVIPYEYGEMYCSSFKLSDLVG